MKQTCVVCKNACHLWLFGFLILNNWVVVCQTNLREHRALSGPEPQARWWSGCSLETSTLSVLSTSFPPVFPLTLFVLIKYKNANNINFPFFLKQEGIFRPILCVCLCVCVCVIQSKGDFFFDWFWQLCSVRWQSRRLIFHSAWHGKNEV